MSKGVRVGMIGAGGIAGTHIGYLQKIEGVEVVAVCDVREDAVKEKAEAFGIPHAFSSYKDLLKLEEVDAVSICTPNFFHKEPAIAALRAGKHVMVEKPMAMSAKEAKAMVEAAEQAKKTLVIGFQWRYNPSAQMLRRAIDDGLMGKIVYARAQALRRRGIPSWGVFGQKELQGGGPLIDIGVHIMEVTHYLMGSPKPVAASANCYTYLGNKKPVTLTPWGDWDHKTYTVEDLAVGLIRFENGATMMVESSFAAHIENNIFNCTLMGEKGGGTFEPPMVFTDMSGTMVDITPNYAGNTDAFQAKMADWIETIRTGKKSQAPGEDGLVVQQMLDALYRSAEKGKEAAIS